MNCKKHINAAKCSLQNEDFADNSYYCFTYSGVLSHTFTEYRLTIQIIHTVTEDSSPLQVKVEIKSQWHK